MWKNAFFNKVFTYGAYKKWMFFMPSKLYLKHLYGVNMHKKLNLSSPVTYNEKLQWIKLYDHDPDYVTMVDKYAVKQYVADIIGEQYIIPTIGVWNNAKEIDFSALPQQFVLKCNHDSGSVIICKNKAELDTEDVVRRLNAGLSRGSYQFTREWPYKKVKRKIIAEPYVEDEKTGELRDYKFFCFNGEVKALFVASDRQKKGESVKFDYFDPDYRLLDFKQDHPHAAVLPEKPSQFELMKKLAAALSQGIPHVRVDFYEANGQVYFGELTFFHHSGIVPFYPETWDRTFGDWLTLPEKYKAKRKTNK